MADLNEGLFALNDDMLVALEARRSHEEALVRTLGDQIGYGRTMQLCEQIWAEKCKNDGLSNGAHATYCCAVFLIPCPGCRPAKKLGKYCEWCCGAGRVTERVAQAIQEASKHVP
jgi:hypothetical protein